MRPLMFGPITAITKSFCASTMLTGVGPLPRMRSLVYFEVLQPREGFLTVGERALIGLFATVNPHVDEELVPGIEGPGARTALPQARKLVLVMLDSILLLVGMMVWLTIVGIFAFVVMFVGPVSAVEVRARGRRFDVPPLDVAHQGLLLGKHTTAVLP